MPYLYFKSIHIIFVVTWFAGLFYLPRLFIYFAEAQERPEAEREILQEQFKIMARRLWFGITWPSAIFTVLFGLSMIHHWFPLTDNPWLILKIALGFLLFIYHLSLGYIRKKQFSGESKYTSFQLRVWNEVSTLFLVSMIFLVVLKDLLAVREGLIGLFILTILLLAGIRIYKKKREMASS